MLKPRRIQSRLVLRAAGRRPTQILEKVGAAKLPGYSVSVTAGARQPPTLHGEEKGKRTERPCWFIPPTPGLK